MAHAACSHTVCSRLLSIATSGLMPPSSATTDWQSASIESDRLHSAYDLQLACLLRRSRTSGCAPPALAMIGSLPGFSFTIVHNAAAARSCVPGCV